MITQFDYIEGGDCLKRVGGGVGLRLFADLRGGLGKKEGVVFLRGVKIPMHTMIQWVFLFHFQFVALYISLKPKPLAPN